MITKACTELERIKNLSAFNVKGAYYSRKVNQNLTCYQFDDGSTLRIYPNTSKGVSYIETVGVIQTAKLQINK